MAYPYRPPGIYGAPAAYPPRPYGQLAPVGAYGAPYGAPYGAGTPVYPAGATAGYGTPTGNPAIYGAPAAYPSYPAAYPSAAPAYYPPAAPAYGGYGVPAPPIPYKSAVAAYRQVPQFYNRPQLTWGTPYQDPRQPFVLPYGIEPHFAAKLMEASYVFRLFDTNCNGFLSKKEFKRALWHLGYHMYPKEASRLFYMLDANRSGQIDEREFAMFWLSTHY